ncbi:MAG: hypothetical protein M1818_007007 [Claussenomyces sp. TS43310]|nr:MAG: hypothetical protein M1818_007007 [Claussenomyces sp. TS43310]
MDVDMLDGESMSTSSWETNSTDAGHDGSKAVPSATESAMVVTEEFECNGLNKNAMPSPSASLAMLQTFSSQSPLIRGLPALLEEIARDCNLDGIRAMQSICQDFATRPQTLRFSRLFGDYRTLSHLPPELLTMIAERCDRKSLQTFRLIGRKYARVATPLLCGSSIHIINTPHGFQKLEGIALHPGVSSTVLEMNCFFADWSHILTRREWTERYMIQHCPGCETDTNQAFHLDQAYQQFEGVLGDQAWIQNDEHDVEALELAFRAFKNLKAVTLHGGTAMAHSMPVRSEFSALVKRAGIPPNRGGVITRAFITTLQAAQNAGAKIKQLTTGQLSIGFLASKDAPMLKAVSEAISHVEKLNISVDLCESALWYKDAYDHNAEDERLSAAMVRRAGAKGLLGKFLQKATKLQEFRIDFGSSMKGRIEESVLEKFLGAKAWPSLKKLSIGRTHCTMDELLSLIRRHKKTLQSLHMAGPSLGEGDWEQFFLELRNDVASGELKLKDVELHGTFEWFDDETGLFACKELCANDEETDESNSLGHDIAEYIKHGGDCPWEDVPQEEMGGMFPLDLLGGLGNVAGLAGWGAGVVPGDLGMFADLADFGG